MPRQQTSGVDWQEAERIVQQALMQKGFYCCNVNDEKTRAPMHIGTNGAIVTPDIDFRGHGISASVEVKRKTSTVIYRKTGEEVTGIDARPYAHYRRFEKESGCTVWLFLLHDNYREVAYAPIRGYLAGDIAYHVDSKTARYGKGGMVYWPYRVFRKVQLEAFVSSDWDDSPLRLYRPIKQEKE